jgi:hypothetical protein
VLTRRVLSALLWIAAFCFAAGIFLSATLLLRGLPPTAPVAIGRVTIEKASKLHDYAAALLFFIIVPLATPWLYRLGTRVDESLRRRVDDEGRRTLISTLFVAPFFLAPLLYLTTFKWGWPVIIPIAAALAGPWIVITFDRTLWLRRLFRRELAPFHALILTEGGAWILFRYVATGKRIAHIPTLFLEIVFVVFFLAIYWTALAVIARIAAFTLHADFEIALQRVAVGALPIGALPLLVVSLVVPQTAITIVMLLVVFAMFLALRRSDPIDGTHVRNAVAYVILPTLLYILSYASTASLTQWIDLFHRGESLGPASDYLRGKVPYRDVFVLHGLLEDGQLDAWLFQLFGRHVEIALARPVILGSFAVPALWYLGMAIFDSIPLAILTILLGAVTTVDNERVFFEIAVLAFLLHAIRRNKPLLAVCAGIFAALALFFSFDIGLYSIGGGLLTVAVLAVMRVIPSVVEGPGSGGRRDSLATDRPSPSTTLGMTVVMFVLGLALGATPFLIYLAMRGALGAFFETSFITLPRIIDAVWSLPYPDLTTTFRKNLNLHTISDFFLYDQFRFILNPLVIGVALVVLVQRAWSRKREPLDVALIALTSFAILTQRSALGRADFPHQYFSAFLIGPMILILAVLFTSATARIWREREPGAQAFLALAAVVVLPMFVFALWVPDIANSRLDDTTRYWPRVTRNGYVDPAAEAIRFRIDDLGYYMHELSKKGAPIYDFSNQPAFYFFTDRPNPTRFYQVPIASPRELQRETIVALEKAKPPVVIRRSPQQFDVFDGVDNSIRAQAIAAYLDDRYEYAVTSRGVELWTRKKTTGPFDPAAYLRQIRMPDKKELNAVGARTRLLFPAVGSVRGVGDSYWRSDLVLHNPFKRPMQLDLRYVSEPARAQRHLVLNGGTTIRWEDLVKTLFGAPESRGLMWIDYRGDYGPVARVKTFDAAHGGKASITSPLSLRDAATFGSEADDLTIVGIPGGGAAARRVNIGIVNIGEIPATFRITAHTRTGQTIGKAVEQGLPEDTPFQLGDADKALGVALDETVTVHVTLVAGTCIAYATVVEPDGDSQFIAAVPSPKL